MGFGSESSLGRRRGREEAAGTDEAPAEEPAAPAGPVVVCEECPGACTLVLDVEDGRVAAVHRRRRESHSLKGGSACALRR